MPSRNPNPFLSRIRHRPVQIISRFQPGASLHLANKKTVAQKIAAAQSGDV